MYGQNVTRNTKGNAKVRRQFLDWYVISRRTFYQIIGTVLAILLFLGGVYAWKRYGEAISGQMKNEGARLVQVVGNVTVHRSKTNRNETAFTGILLEPGDTVITSGDASAVIQYVDRSVLKMKADSTVLIQENAENSKTGQKTVRNKLEGGQLTISTSSQTTSEDVNIVKVKDDLTIRVAQNSNAGVDVRGENIRVNVERGGVESTNAKGITEVINKNTSVQYQKDRKVGQEVILNSPPLKAPDNSTTIALDLGKASQISFSWGTVPEAAAYRLQVADSQYFLDKALLFEKVTDQPNFPWLVNSLNGSYYWRVQAIGRDGREGAWSEESHLTLISRQNMSSSAQPIYIGETNVSRIAAGICSITGRTEPGVQLKINGRAVPVDGDGKFSATIPGRSFLVEARDSYGRVGQKTLSR